ncbi:MAG: N-acetylmuramoyl-L-alanine amidase [Clostridiales bacterium]|nr:N-acetylmuramoyl-L-alanine amidase [Clostridiales bacterium]
MSKPTIYIAAGHGGSDPGAVSGKYIEKALTLKTALACQNYLKNYECETIMARTTDVDCKVADKMEEVEQKRPSLVLEIHYNAGGGEGCEVYYWHNHAPSKALAQAVLSQMTALGQPTKPSTGGGSGVIAIGSTVKVTGTKYATGQTIPGWVKSTTHKVSEISGDRALLGRDGGICSWVYLRDLTPASGDTAKPVEAGCKVTINKGAVYGGLTSARGNKVPSSQLAPKKHTVSKIQTNKGVREALLKEIVSWVAVSSLTRA